MRRRPSRLAGESSRSGKKEDSASTIIVDSREFKAELPSALYRHGFKLQPFTLNICDYVLTPSIGVERKSFQDLVNSLNHGRLQKQMEHMARVYAYPLLLIEMNKRHYGLFRRTGEITRTAVKLVILMRSYPKMRILWSFQDSSSARMFELIKKGKQEPVLEKIMDTSGDSYLNGNKSDVDRIDLLLSTVRYVECSLFQIITKCCFKINSADFDITCFIMICKCFFNCRNCATTICSKYKNTIHFRICCDITFNSFRHICCYRNIIRCI